MSTRNIKDAKDLSTGELIYFKGHAQATYMSDGSTVEDTVKNIFEKIYPAGSIYISATNVNPNILFGIGEWEQIKDTFLLAAGDTYTAGSFGGEAEHTLTIDEMPEHAHKVGTEQTDALDAFEYGIYKAVNVGDTGLNGGNRYWSANTYETGGSMSHNNMPPYLTVYMWKRIK